MEKHIWFNDYRKAFRKASSLAYQALLAGEYEDAQTFIDWEKALKSQMSDYLNAHSTNS